MDSLCSGWRRKQALDGYQQQFSNENNILDTLEMKLSGADPLGFPNSLLFYKNRVLKSSLLCYVLWTPIFQTLKCRLRCCLYLVSSAGTSKASYGLEKSDHCVLYSVK